uniref:Uncharacterized protein n=1 Tax=Anopheles atroparvus TaxID=41427 RepID=A0A182IQP4_ANOAO
MSGSSKCTLARPWYGTGEENGTSSKLAHHHGPQQWRTRGKKNLSGGLPAQQQPAGSLQLTRQHIRRTSPGTLEGRPEETLVWISCGGPGETVAKEKLLEVIPQTMAWDDGGEAGREAGGLHPALSRVPWFVLWLVVLFRIVPSWLSAGFKFRFARRGTPRMHRPRILLSVQSVPFPPWHDRRRSFWVVSPARIGDRSLWISDRPGSHEDDTEETICAITIAASPARADRRDAAQN